MGKREFYQALAARRPDLLHLLRPNERLAEHCTLRVGGPADWFLSLSSKKDLLDVLLCCRSCSYPYLLLGCGSNMVFSDEGFRGIVLCTGKSMCGIRVIEEDWTALCDDAAAVREDQSPASSALSDVLSRAKEQGATIVRAEAGATLAALAQFALKNSLTGLEFAAGIPGSVGGAVYMNAGAYGSAISDICLLTEALAPEGTSFMVRGDEHAFAYRDSYFKKKPSVILASCFLLRPAPPRQIRARMTELSLRRRRSQPLDRPSAGSVFKRPEGYFTGQLIMEAGLQGARVGGAEVSRKHAGFIINRGAATAADVVALIEEIQKAIWMEKQVKMEPEIRIIDAMGRNRF